MSALPMGATPAMLRAASAEDLRAWICALDPNHAVATDDPPRGGWTRAELIADALALAGEDGDDAPMTNATEGAVALAIAEQYARLLRETGIGSDAVASAWTNGEAVVEWTPLGPSWDVATMLQEGRPDRRCGLYVGATGSRQGFNADADPRADACQLAADALLAWCIRVGRVELDPQVLASGRDGR